MDCSAVFGCAVQNEAHLMNIVMESDIGTFQPLGFRFTGSSEAKGIVSEIMRYMQPFNASRVLNDADGSDIEMWFADHVPGGSLLNQNDRYHDFHHSNGEFASRIVGCANGK